MTSLSAQRYIKILQNSGDEGFILMMGRLTTGLAAGVLTMDDLHAATTHDDRMALAELPSVRAAWTAARFRLQAREAGVATAR